MKFLMIVVLLSISLASFAQNSLTTAGGQTLKPWIDCDGDTYPKKN